MVRAAEVAAVVPSVAGRPDSRNDAGGPLHQSRLLSGAALRAALTARARDLGFDALGVASVAGLPDQRPRLEAWLADGHHGGMGWMAERREQRASPSGLWPAVRSVVMVGVNYAGGADPLAAIERADRGSIAAYAQRRDYHEVIKGRLKDLAGFLVSRAGGDVKVFVDTAPVMERPLAMAAGIGWQGKNAMLVSRRFGNWLLLGALYTTVEIEPDAVEADHCGSCTRCLDRCPTAAFVAPYVLDARRCIAYLTIEHHGPIPAGFRAAIGNRVFGCDDCLAVCPWNKFASDARHARLAAQDALGGLKLADLAQLDDPSFRRLFAGTPVKRLGRDRFLRNVLIAIGNSGDPALAEAARARLDDAAPGVRAMAVWALGRLLAAVEFRALAGEWATQETDAEVREEWIAALPGSGKSI